MLGVTPQRAARALEKTRADVRRCRRLLADGRRYLVGDALTFADITFASLGALAVLPPEYPGGASPAAGSTSTTSIPRGGPKSNGFRERPAGQFILRLYREERPRQPAAAP